MTKSPTRDFIDTRLGGTESAAAKTQRKPSAVRMWVHRGRIPREVWPDLLDAYPKLRMQDLRALEQKVSA